MKKIIMAALAAFIMIAEPAEARLLSINDQTKPESPIVYDLENNGEKTKALEYLQLIHDKFYKNAEFIDAEKTAPETLKEKLKNGFVLYTVTGKESQLLKETANETPVKISGNDVTVGNRNFKTENLRVIFAGRNPFGDGFCTVYAAKSNEFIYGINNLYHGSNSYYVFNGNKLLSSGKYDDSFMLRQGIPLAGALEDTEDFFRNLEMTHPDLLSNISPGDYLQLKNKTLTDIASKLDKQGEVALPDMAYALYYAAAAFRDGHTSVYYTKLPQELLNAARFPPFSVTFRNGRYFITAASDKSLEGFEIHSVNDIPFSQFIKPILDRCSGEGLPLKARRFTSNQEFWWGFSGLCSQMKSINITAISPDGKKLARSLAVVNETDFRLLKGNSKGGTETTSLSFQNNGNVAVLRYPKFIKSESEKQAIEKAFAEIRAKGSSALIIDMRGNGGGNSTMGDLIMTYLTEKPFRAAASKQVKISANIFDEGKGVGEEFRPLTGLKITSKLPETVHARPEMFFSGRAYLLTDNGTFSSATMFAAMFRDYECGEIIGYETGGFPTSFGDLIMMKLRNSQIGYSVSCKRFESPRPKPGDDEHGVLPSVPVTEELLAQYRDREDPVLAFTLDRIKHTITNAKSPDRTEK